jgi:hypothetical protein
MSRIAIVLRRPPSPDADFVEVECDGKSILAGFWEERLDGLWELVLSADLLAEVMTDGVQN